MRSRLAAGSLMLFGLLALVHGQEPAFRSSVTYIEVDAFVTDGGGAFVKDLRREDFEIVESGRVQTISTFSFVDLHKADAKLSCGLGLR